MVKSRRQSGLKLDKDFLGPLFQNVSDAVVLFGEDLRILAMNPAAEKLTGYRAGDAIGEMFSNEMFSCQDSSGDVVCDQICPRVRKDARAGNAMSLDVGISTRDGRAVILPGRCIGLEGKDGARIAALLIRDAVSERDLEEQVIETRRIDPLTGLFNRQYFEELYRKEIQRAQRHGGRMAVVRLDITGLKRINESHGEKVGDEVLHAVAAMLKETTRAVDIASRFGDDEFAVLLLEAEIGNARSLVARLRQNMGEWNRAGRFPVPVEVRIGIGAADRDYDTLLKQAKDALE